MPNPTTTDTLTLQESGIFAMPDSMDTINDWIDRHYPHERIHLYLLQGMYYNLLCKNLTEAHRIEVELSDGTKAMFKRA